MLLLFLVPAALLLLGVADMPGGYYTFMRIVVCLVSCIAAVGSYIENDEVNIWTILFGLIAILFNPIIPVYLHNKSVWMTLDIICATVFIVRGFLLRRKETN